MTKKIIIASPYFPFPITGGGHQALFNEIEALRNNFKIVLVCPFASENNIKVLKNIWKNVEICVLSRNQVEPIKSFTKSLINFFKQNYRKNELTYFYDERFLKTHFSILYDFNEKWFNFINESILNFNCDIIQIEFFPFLNNVVCLPENKLKIFVHHEIGFIKLQRTIALTGLSDKYKDILIQSIKDQEVYFLNKYDKIITFSEMDKQYLLKNGVTKEIIASPFPYISRETNVKTFSFNNNLIMLGGERNFPNVDGLQWFLEVIWPTLLETYVNIQLMVIGRWSDQTKKKLSNKNVQFVGYIENLNEYIKNTISIVPIRIGSGIRVKILEALSIGVPVISTSVGAEGLEYFKEDMFIANNKDDFLLAIKKINDNQNGIAVKIQGANKKIKQFFSIDCFQKTRHSIYS